MKQFARGLSFSDRDSSGAMKKELTRRYSFSDRVRDSRIAMKKELMRRFSFSDRVSDSSGAMKEELTRRYSFSDRVRDSRVAMKKELIRRFSFSGRVSDSGVPRGCVPVLVCGGDVDGEGGERFVVRVEALRHPSFAALLEDAAQEFGYKQEGVLRVPCAVPRFRDVLAAVSDPSAPHAGR